MILGSTSELWPERGNSEKVSGLEWVPSTASVRRDTLWAHRVLASLRLGQDPDCTPWGVGGKLPCAELICHPPLPREKSVLLVTQSRLTLSNPIDCSSQSSSVHGILQARILECVAIHFSRESS